MYIYIPVSPINAIFFFLFFKGWIGGLKNVAGFGLAGGGARRTRALLLSCAVRSAAPGGPARPLAGPPAVATAAAAAAAPWPRPSRVPAASPRRPPARVPGERWSGVGPVCLPPAPSPESPSPTERRGEARAGEGGGSERPLGRAQRGPPPSDLPRWGAGTHPDHPTGRRPLPRFETGETQPVTNEQPLCLTLPLSVNFDQLEGVGLLSREKENSS